LNGSRGSPVCGAASPAFGRADQVDNVHYDPVVEIILRLVDDQRASVLAEQQLKEGGRLLTGRETSRRKRAATILIEESSPASYLNWGSFFSRGS
jgi:hypothetical protein